MTTKIDPKSPTARRAAAAVIENPGLTTFQLADILGWGMRHTVKAMTAASEAGKIGNVRVGGSRWWPAEMVAEVDAKMRAVQRQKELQAFRDNNAKKREQRATRLAEQVGAPDMPDEFTRRVLPGDSPLPFVCRAPASVFHLGRA